MPGNKPEARTPQQLDHELMARDELFKPIEPTKSKNLQALHVSPVFSGYYALSDRALTLHSASAFQQIWPL
jgi:hypothetical protein